MASWGTARPALAPAGRRAGAGIVHLVYYRMARFAARIHVLLASGAPVGLVIRRGPSKSVATLLWNRKNDEFQLGQWLKGRIYERRSDLSPDGKHFLYFAMNGKWQKEAHGSWTAISRAPFLKALAIFPKGDCWNGGGLWTGTHIKSSLRNRVPAVGFCERSRMERSGRRPATAVIGTSTN
jgi:hypothetical protein